MVQFDSEALWFIMMKHLFFIIHIYNTEDEGIFLKGLKDAINFL